MSDIALMLEEIRNKLDELNNKTDRLDKKVDNLTNKIKILINYQYGSKTLKEIEPELIKQKENFPHLITKEKYKEDNRYAKIEIIYYEVDGVFATLEDKLVEYLDEEYFGYDNLNLFDTSCNIYLRDETIHIDYHIVYEGCTSYFDEHKGE